MVKKAHYYITALRYNDSDKDYIKSVKRHEVNDDGSFNSNKYEEIFRSSVASDINSKWKYMTLYSNNGKWNFGEYVHVVNIDGSDFIRTDQNKTKTDNLGNLPIF